MGIVDDFLETLLPLLNAACSKLGISKLDSPAAFVACWLLERCGASEDVLSAVRMMTSRNGTVTTERIVKRPDGEGPAKPRPGGIKNSPSKEKLDARDRPEQEKQVTRSISKEDNSKRESNPGILKHDQFEKEEKDRS